MMLRWTVILVSSNLWQFLCLALSFMVLKSSGQLFCRMLLNFGLFCFLMIGFSLSDFDKNTIEAISDWIQFKRFWQEHHRSDIIFFLVHYIRRHLPMVIILITWWGWVSPDFLTVKLLPSPLHCNKCLVKILCKYPISSHPLLPNF